MNKMITQDEFYETVKVLVDDAFAFSKESPMGKNMAVAGAPAHLYRCLQINPRRAIGKTYAATRLANDFDPTMIVFPNTDLMRRTVDQYQEHGYYPTNGSCAFVLQQVCARDFLPRLGQLPRLGEQTLPSHFRLGIIDDANKIKYDNGREAMYRLRHIMAECCDVILELG